MATSSSLRGKKEGRISAREVNDEALSYLPFEIVLNLGFQEHAAWDDTTPGNRELNREFERPTKDR
jgi:hypothetical protein